jgi:cysteine desulfurase
MKFMRDRLHKGLLNRIAGIRLNGDLQRRLPNTLSISFRGLEANRILEDIGLEVAASAGAACHADSVEISHVLEAMGIPLEWAKGTLRFSVGRMTTEAEIDTTIRVVAEAVNPNPDNLSRSYRSGDPAGGVAAKRKSRFIGGLNIDDCIFNFQ